MPRAVGLRRRPAVDNCGARGSGGAETAASRVRDRDGVVGLRLREAPIGRIECQTRDLLARGGNRTLTPHRPDCPLLEPNGKRVRRVAPWPCQVAAARPGPGVPEWRRP